MTVTIHIKKGNEYIWRVAKAYAQQHDLKLSELIVKALTEYVIRNP